MAKLSSNESNVKFNSEADIELKREMKDVNVFLQIFQESKDLLFDTNKYSNLRVTAYIIHFIKNYKHKSERKSGRIYVEVADAENYWVHLIQKI